ncbi:DUF937 domain-containing protein [Phyllobacterium sp. SYP-B3895]|uniref:DUF937 domain-containing protein n=1 Tax=Phyllobacterium sp. SYP-B3895 TaxID=2663240 RepID=UPI001299E89D|nr:DUF937 domain-containing protein [Phyllobacterium sp. SYP-B3895]MRG56289.1 DUF937 domain-containing protein [Phyllobacterium sp. SYP-B3895]
MNLVDMFLKGQGGQNIEALSRQFNLSQQQTVAAIQALMPAFSQGLQRNAADPMGFGAFIQALSAGQHTNYFDNPQAAFNSSGVANGNNILGQLFGSKDLSRAVADHAAQMTGLGAETLRQMLPVIASMMMGGLYNKSTGQFAASGLGGGNVIGDLIEQMMRQGGAAMGGGQPAPNRQSAPDASANPWGQILEGMFGGGAASQQGQGQSANPLGNNPLGQIFEEMMKGGLPGAAQQAPTPRSHAPQDDGSEDTAQGQNPFGDNPLGKIFEEMLGGGAPRGTPPPQPQARQRQAQPDPDAPAPSDNPLKDILGQMFDTGRQANDQYQKGLESIFDQYLRGMDRSR